MKDNKKYYTSVFLATGLFLILSSVIFARLLNLGFKGTHGGTPLGNNARVLSVSDQKIDEEMLLPQNFPSDFPVYPDSKVVSSNQVKEPNVEGISILLKTTDPLNHVLNYYLTELEKFDWITGVVVGTSDTATFSVEKGNVEGFVAILNISESESEVSVTLGIKDNVDQL